MNAAPTAGFDYLVLPELLPEDGHPIYRNGGINLVLMLHSCQLLVVDEKDMALYRRLDDRTLVRTWVLAGVDDPHTLDWYVRRIAPHLDLALGGICFDETGDAMFTGHAETQLRYVASFVLRSMIYHDNWIRGGRRDWVTPQEWFDECLSMGLEPPHVAVDARLGAPVEDDDPDWCVKVGRRYGKLAHVSDRQIAFVPGELDHVECVESYLASLDEDLLPVAPALIS